MQVIPLARLLDEHAKLSVDERCKHVACAGVHVYIQHKLCMLAAPVCFTRQLSCAFLNYAAAGKAPLWVLLQLHKAYSGPSETPDRRSFVV